ncbi:pimeloyl-ACP methyl ester carboxylesterase [Rhodococcus sp. 27YEA15]|uniref:alpha/beta fold hydrolase n=1 Tax=Rhodococcus sp. 27YEA15 TaxID=3156259 RepID=UPI003C7CE020
MPEMFHVKPPGDVITVGEDRLHVLAEGAGPVVVLCGGLAGNWFDWDDCARHLRTDHTVVRFDRPGFGLSEPSTEIPTTRGEAQRIVDVLDMLALPGPAVVVGHSIAGFYVEGFARLHPERAAGMLLLDSSADRDPRRILPRDLLISASRAAAVSFSTTGLQRLLGTTTRKILNQSVPPGGPSEVTLAWVRRIYREPHYLEAAMIEYVAYTDMAQELRELRDGGEHPLPEIPIAVVAAHTGHTTPWSTAWTAKQQRLATYLGGQFRVLRPAHHHAMIDQPEELAGLIRDLAP